MSRKGQTMVRWSGEVQVNVMECQVNVKSQSELDIDGRETCIHKFLRSHTDCFIECFSPILSHYNSTGILSFLPCASTL